MLKYLIIVLSFISLCVIFVTRVTINKVSTLNDSSEKIITNSNTHCSSLTEEQCFDLLTDCSVDIRSSIEKNEIAPPLKPKLQNVKFYIKSKLLGGGDYKTVPTVNLNNKFCPLNFNNAKYLFAPISTKEEAYLYYKFIKKDIGGALAKDTVYFEPIYDGISKGVVYPTNLCRNTNLQILEKKDTTIKYIDNIYELNLITFKPMGSVVFEETKIKISINGEVTEEKPTVLVSCGPGLLY